MQSLRRSLARAVATHLGAAPTPTPSAAAAAAAAAAAPLAAWLQPRRRLSSTACSWPPKTAKAPDPVTEALAAQVVTACDAVLAAGGGAASHHSPFHLNASRRSYQTCAAVVAEVLCRRWKVETIHSICRPHAAAQSVSSARVRQMLLKSEVVTGTGDTALAFGRINWVFLGAPGVGKAGPRLGVPFLRIQNFLLRCHSHDFPLDV